MKGKRIMVLLALLVGLVSPAFAQTDQARIVGSVRDSQGGAVHGAEVTVIELRTSRERSAVTNDQGYFVVTGLAPSKYKVTVKAPDLEPTEIPEASLGVGQERTIDVVLRPGTVTQSVTVSAGALAVMDTSSARIGVNVSEREVSQLPLNGRQVSQLYLLAPGAVNNGRGTYDDIRFSGRSNQQNIIRFDGIEGTSIIDQSPGNLNGEVTSSFRLQTSTENVQEFRVESSNYPAEYGTGTGGQVSIVTKSGSNDFHGSVFEFLRNDALDARNFFDRGGKSPLKVNQFGASVGGPIVRDKFFFFASYEGLRQHAGINLIELVPSPAARARAVPSIQPLLAAYPSTGAPTSNPDFLSASLNSSSTVNEDSAGIRFDYKISPNYSLYMRYFRDQGKSILPLGVTGNSLNVTAVPQNAVVNFQQVLTSRIVNETKFGFNDVKTRGSGSAPSIPGVDIGALSLNIGGQVAIAGIAGQTASAGVAIPGGLVRANSATNGRGQPYTNYSLSFIDNLSVINGNHSMKFGVEVRPLRLYTDRLGGTTYTFSNLDDFLANRPQQIQFLGDVSAPSPFNGGATGSRLAKQTYYIAYGQDEWKLRPNVTVNLGLRYEYYSVLHEDRNLDVIFDPTKGVILPSNTPFYHSSPHNFGPRLAVSWAPEKLKNNTIFRIGGGYYFGNGQTEDQIQPIESDRVSRTLPAGTVYPINPAEIIRTYDINSPTLGYQPRAYWPTYTIPERILSYTASVQQKLPGDTILTVAYVGSQGRNLFLRSWSNKIIGVGTNPTTGKAIVTREFGNRFAEVDYKTSGGADHYDAMQTSLNRRFAQGLTLGAQWSWAHSIGNSQGSNEARTSQNPFFITGERGNNNFDVRHSLNVSALYELPFGKGRRYLSDAGTAADLVLGGWQLGGVLNARTGVPVEVLVTRPDVVFQVNSRGAAFGLQPGTFVNQEIVARGVVITDAVLNTPGGGASRGIRRPDVVPGVSPFVSGQGKTIFFNPAAFSIPTPGNYGNLARNALHGPSMQQLDLTLQKRFRVTERVNLEFRSEFYNILNKANFANPPVSLPNALPSAVLNKDGSVRINSNGTVSLNGSFQPGQPFTRSAAASFGILNSTVTRDVGIGTNRQIQLSLRLNF